MVGMLSIVIITKNEQDYLPRLLESIRTQSFNGEFEIIVSDAQSTDKTREIATIYGCKIVDGGLPAVGRNNGAKVAKGDILLFLDADIILSVYFLEKNIEEMEKRGLDVATPTNVPLSPKLIDHFLYGFYNRLILFCQTFLPLAGGFCIFCKKDLFEKVNGFDEKIVMAEDHDFVRRAGKIGKFRILKSVPCLNDVRRLDKEGRLKLVGKYMYGAYHYVFKGNMYKFPFDYELQGGVNVKTKK